LIGEAVEDDKPLITIENKDESFSQPLDATQS